MNPILMYGKKLFLYEKLTKDLSIISIFYYWFINFIKICELKSRGTDVELLYPKIITEFEPEVQEKLKKDNITLWNLHAISPSLIFLVPFSLHLMNRMLFIMNFLQTTTQTLFP